mmetsp:Transcript_4134/g.9221  ORF Transcript_4134/g.9221 Transcript_4134/m.9221 type:complete len:790 (+) Transcript_4134:682-3051(+)
MRRWDWTKETVVRERRVIEAEATATTTTTTATTAVEEAHLLLEELRTVVTRLEDLARRVRRAASRDRDDDENEHENENDSPRFLRLDERDEGDAVEWLRRIAELVASSERKAGRLSRRGRGGGEGRNGNGNGNGPEKGNTGNNDIPPEGEGRRRRQHEEEMALPYLSLFEFFCEKNVLALVVNIVTGAAFADDASPSVRLLPPLSIATQSIQSVSILVQNVSRPTTLYYLLSNNRVNDLIDLPLRLYQRAAWREGAEAGELTTHFVSFLKSLAMRVNRETLQFFLSFPGTNEKEEVEEEKEEKRDDDEKPLGDADDVDGETKQEAMKSKTVSEGASTSRRPRRRIVEFPLYARALEFCASEQDSFVRVTAMNVCMNLVRLAARCEEDDAKPERDNNHRDVDDVRHRDTDDGTHSDDDDGLPTETPSGTLHEAPSLPLRDRIAIVEYACHPRRVYDLVSPLCSRLTTQFGQVEGTVRALQELGHASNDDDAAISKRRKLRQTMDDLAANVQDELLLLDDLLKIGVVSLNEQAIELVLATFVYPMLLQPLLLPLHRFSSFQMPPSASSKEPASPKGPVIALQSPEPFAPLSKERVPSASDHDSDDDHDADKPPFPPPSSPRRVEPRHPSSRDTDLAPSKTALFGLCIVSDTVTDPSLRRLLLAASWHPLSPPATGGPVVRVAPRAAVPLPRAGSEDVRWEIRLERRSDETRDGENEDEEESEGIDVGGSTYGFGTDFPIDHVSESSSNVDDDDRCVFVLAPGLVKILRGGTDTSRSPDDNNDASKIPIARS